MSTFRRILAKRNFWPLFGALSFGAFNDNFFRSAILAMIAFSAYTGGEESRSIQTSLANVLLMLPFFLFSSIAGEVADKMRKSFLVKLTKSTELIFMFMAAVFFYYGNINMLLATLFLMGLQSTFFGPLKYGLLPEVLPEKDLVAGNGLVEAATFLAIVIGTMFGSSLAVLEGGQKIYMPVALITAGILGLGLALKQPSSEACNPGLKINFKIWQSTYQIIKSVHSRQGMWLSILAISWFWAMGAILLTQLPVLCREVIGGAPSVNTFMVTMFALGVGIGSIAAQRILKGRVSVRLTPGTAALLFLFLLCLAINVCFLPEPVPGAAPLKLGQFLSHPVYLSLACFCLLLSITAGIFVVPLNAFLQHMAKAQERSRVIAANNIMNSLFICIGSGIVIILTKLGFSLAYVFISVAVSAAIVSILTMYFLPGDSLRQVVLIMLRIFIRPRIEGLENIEKVADGPALVVANHTSFLDAVLLVAYIPRRLTFAIDSYWAKVWWVKPFLHAVRALPVNPAEPMATRSLIEALNNGDMVVIFPEGRITSTGSLMKIYEGPALVATKGKAPIVPAVFDGLQYGMFSRYGKHVSPRPKAKVRLTFLAPQHLNVPPKAGEKQKELRHRAGEALFDMMMHSAFKAMDKDVNMWDALVHAGKRYRMGKDIIEDINRKMLSYRGFINKAKILGHHFRQFSAKNENIGLLLPNSTALLVSAFGLWSVGRTAVMMNFTQGLGPLTSAVETAQIKTIFTSRAFLENTNLTEMAEKLPARLICLEDLHLNLLDKIKGLLAGTGPTKASGPAAIVFTSGSEGKPKGVVLSHANLMSNVNQFKCHIQINENDVMFNALPLFHAFGLTVGALLPLLTGMRSMCYVSPLHTRIIPELIYDTQATIVVASDTFAAAWGKNAHPYDFANVRYMVVGAEKLKARTNTLYFEKFGLRIFEGYGVSEAAPVLAVNTAMHFRAGTVGRILPCIESRLAQVEGVGKGGRLQVKGPNIMLGYLRPEQPGFIVPPEDGWYDTGDIVEIDHDGYVWIKGRFKRFAKVGGEMVSLAAVEEVAAQLWPGRPQVVIAVEDENKGEKLVLVTDDPAPDLAALWAAQKEAGMAELSYPRQFVYMEEIPVTPVGKINMPRLIEKAHEAMAKG